MKYAEIKYREEMREIEIDICRNNSPGYSFNAVITVLLN